jgi:hypothetical protein
VKILGMCSVLAKFKLHPLNASRASLVRQPAQCQYYIVYLHQWGMRHGWLRHYVTNRKVAGSSPDEMDVFFN